MSSPRNERGDVRLRVKDKELLVDGDGQLIDKEKQPVPVHTPVHAWGYLTYDSDRQKFALLSWNGTGNQIPKCILGGAKQMDEGLKLLEEQLKDKKKRGGDPFPRTGDRHFRVRSEG